MHNLSEITPNSTTSKETSRQIITRPDKDKNSGWVVGILVVFSREEINLSEIKMRLNIFNLSVSEMISCPVPFMTQKF